MTPEKVILKRDIESAKQSELWLKLEDIPFSKRNSLDDRRRSAWNRYLSLAMPDRMDETWRRVDLTKMPYDVINQSHLTGKLNKPEMEIESADDLRSKGVLGVNLLDAENIYSDLVEKAIDQLIDPDMDKFAALAAAQADSGAFLYVPRGLSIDQPIRISLSCSGDTLALFNHLIWLEPDTKLTLILDYRLKDTKHGTQLNIGSTGMHIGENATLTVVELQPDGKNTWNIIHERAQLEKNSNLVWIVCSAGSRLTKDFIQIDLTQPGAEAKVAGLYIPSDHQQVEFETRQNHLSPNTTSDLLFKGVLLNESSSLFRGMIYVAPKAVKTDGYQANRNLILGPKAHADSLPGLEILADDVQCSHGATIGNIDPEELFYLQTRGLGKGDARQLIVQGFLDPIIQRIPLETERIRIQKRIERKMSLIQ